MTVAFSSCSNRALVSAQLHRGSQSSACRSPDVGRKACCIHCDSHTRGQGGPCCFLGMRSFTVWWSGVVGMEIVHRIKSLERFKVALDDSLGFFWHGRVPAAGLISSGVLIGKTCSQESSAVGGGFVETRLEAAGMGISPCFRCPITVGYPGTPRAMKKSPHDGAGHQVSPPLIEVVAVMMFTHLGSTWERGFFRMEQTWAVSVGFVSLPRHRHHPRTHGMIHTLSISLNRWKPTCWLSSSMKDMGRGQNCRVWVYLINLLAMLNRNPFLAGPRHMLSRVVAQFKVAHLAFPDITCACWKHKRRMTTDGGLGISGVLVVEINVATRQPSSRWPSSETRVLVPSFVGSVVIVDSQWGVLPHLDMWDMTCWRQIIYCYFYTKEKQKLHIACTQIDRWSNTSLGVHTIYIANQQPQTKHKHPATKQVDISSSPSLCVKKKLQEESLSRWFTSTDLQGSSLTFFLQDHAQRWPQLPRSNTSHMSLFLYLTLVGNGSRLRRSCSSLELITICFRWKTSRHRFYSSGTWRFHWTVQENYLCIKI